MNASEYPVTFGYGEITYPYSPGHPHSGDDRKLPVGTPIDVGTTVIGMSGGAKDAPGSGSSTGPHLHIQKMVQGEYQDPGHKGLGNTVTFPATVIEIGCKSDAGNYVRILDAKGVRWSYFHLSKIKVKEGDVITGESLVDATTAEVMYRLYLEQSVSDWGKKNAVGKMTPKELQEHLRKSDRFKKLQEAAKAGKLNPLLHLPAELRDVYKKPEVKILAPGNYVVKEAK